MTQRNAPPACVFIGDDFTGASDTLATFSRAGARTKLFLAPPSADECTDLDAIGIATALRSMDIASMTDECSRIGPLIRELGARFYHYKVCSTFDSSAQIGSIGAAVRALAGFLQPALTIIIGGQPSLGRYCHFGNLFARASDGEVYRIDRHPVMAHHPVTPMSESDLRLHLGKQGIDNIELVNGVELDIIPETVAARLRQAATGDGGVFLVDAGQQAHVTALGKMVLDLDEGRPVLLVGSSSVAEALCVQRPPAKENPVHGSFGDDDPLPVFIFAGSRSSVTADQVQHASRYDAYPLTPDILADPFRLTGLVEHVGTRLKQGHNVLVHLQHEADYGLTSDVLARRSADFVSAVAKRNPLAGLGVAGGDTSSHVVAGLGIRSLTHIADGDRGVALCAGEMPDSKKPLFLMLKGGQMGHAQLFDHFADICRGASR
ncbi:MAG: four-carbon acid sugar kinase family protein [Allorhizobium sp.]